MAKYQTKCFTNAKPLYLTEDGGPEYSVIDIEYPTTALASGDLIQAAFIPPSYKVLDWFFTSPDIDTGSLAFSLGVENAGGTDLGTEVWGTAITSASTGVPFRNVLGASAQGDITAGRIVDLKVTTAPTAYSGSGKVGQLVLLLQG